VAHTVGGRSGFLKLDLDHDPEDLAEGEDEGASDTHQTESIHRRCAGGRLRPLTAEVEVALTLLATVLLLLPIQLLAQIMRP
jgi:hypothetical protein